jgi:hypothetical protein
LIFQIEDQHYKRGNELTNRERKILLKVVMDFYRWLEPPSATPSRSEETEKPGTSIESKQVQDLRREILPPEMLQGAQAELQTELRPPAGVVGRALGATITAPDSSPSSMVAQVDSILQEKLEAANMKKWAVRLTESPSKGMIVMVGMDRYEAIDDVPYERVRSIIRASVAEWERRTEAGDTDQ